MNELAGVFAVFGGVVFLVFLFLYLTFRSLRRKRLMEDLPTVKTTGVFIGLVEVKGSAECGKPLTGFLSEKPCVWYSWSIEEHYSRTVTETYTDSKGKTQTRTRTESGWKTLASDRQQTRFFLQDDEGRVRIDPAGAEIHGIGTFSHECRRGDPFYDAKGNWGPISDSTHRRRFVETAIPLHQTLYVVGRSRLREDAVAAEIAYDKQSPIFLISTKDEMHHRSQANLFFVILSSLYFVAAAALAIFVGVQMAEHQFRLDGIQNIIWPILTGALVMLLVSGIWFGFWLWTVYNSLVGIKNRVKQAWSNIDVELKRRNDLIASLVDVVKGFAQYEKELQGTLTFLRTQTNVTEPGENGPDPEACSPRLVAVIENYPQIKSNDLYRKLHDNLVETEQRIALARGYYNEMVGYHNDRRERVPECYVAALAGLTTHQYFQAADFEKVAISVKDHSLQVGESAIFPGNDPSKR